MTTSSYTGVEDNQKTEIMHPKLVNSPPKFAIICRKAPAADTAKERHKVR